MVDRWFDVSSLVNKEFAIENGDLFLGVNSDSLVNCVTENYGKIHHAKNG